MTTVTYEVGSTIWDCIAGPTNCSTVRGFSNMELIPTVYDVQNTTFSNLPVDYIYNSATIPLIH
jgi:hypothetical protein